MIKVNGKKVAGIGQPGLNGKSAYETAKEGGFTGTEKEFNTILANSALKPIIKLIALYSSAWSNNTQTVNIIGVLSDEGKQIICPTPTIKDIDIYNNSGIQCINQQENSLTFKAQKIPENDIQIYIILQEVRT